MPPARVSNSNVEKAKAETVPRAMRVSMLAVRARARTTAERTNGHPAQNTTGIARAAVVKRAQVACGQARERTRVAAASGQATTSRRNHAASSAACSDATPGEPAGRGSRRYPARATAAIRSPSEAGALPSSSTVARPVAKLTPAPATPGWRWSVRSTRAAHDAQVMPPTSKTRPRPGPVGWVSGAGTSDHAVTGAPGGFGATEGAEGPEGTRAQPIASSSPLPGPR